MRLPFTPTAILSLVVLVWCASAFALNPDRDIHQLAHRSWGEKDGYPGRAEALAQTADGFLWIGTDIGLFRFDGVHFERYVPRSGDKLSEGPVHGLLALPDGSLWIAYRLENEICVLRNGNVKCYGKADGVTSSPTPSSRTTKAPSGQTPRLESYASTARDGSTSARTGTSRKTCHI